MSSNTKGGYVYLLCDMSLNGIYKIGVTRGSIENRIKKLQTGNAGKIELFKCYWAEHPFLLEKRLHAHYTSEKVLNEWFELRYDEAIRFEETCKEQEKILHGLRDNPYLFSEAKDERIDTKKRNTKIDLIYIN